MRYEYKITPIDKEQETIEAMSYKKMLKTLVNKHPNTIVTCIYTNKKKNLINKMINTKDIKQKD